MKNCSFKIDKYEDHLKAIEKLRSANEDFFIRKGRRRSFCVQVFGCQMNEEEGTRMRGILEDAGAVETDSPDRADIIIYNTCCIRENAEKKVYGKLGSIKKLKERNPELIIAVFGCMTQQQSAAEKLKKSYRHIDIVSGTGNINAIPDMIYDVIVTRKRTFDLSGTEKSPEGMPYKREEKFKSWLTIMYGCNNFCTYCIVPYVRGRERSRSEEDILREARLLAADGVKEITLLGQNVNSYGTDRTEHGESEFGRLLRKLNAIDGLERIRFMTSHPKDFSDDIIAAIAECDKVCKHVHLPLQSGSSRILKAMNRKYTAEQYFELLTKLRARIPGVSVSTDIIAGFPGETEMEHKETVEFVRKCKFDAAYVFIYSARKGTPAAEYADQIPEEVKHSRFDEIQDIQTENTMEESLRLEGHTVKVLHEGYSATNPDKMTGRTDGNKIVIYDPTDKPRGSMIDVHIDTAKTWYLEGTIQ